MPIKRTDFLKPLSRDHHHGLLLCSKIRVGFKKHIDPQRIKKYANWFFETHLTPHFETEEKNFFPILGNENSLVVKAKAEHQYLRKLFAKSENLEANLNLIADELNNHIRFEERELFPAIEEKLTNDQLNEFATAHKEERFMDNLSDSFWL